MSTSQKVSTVDDLIAFINNAKSLESLEDYSFNTLHNLIRKSINEFGLDDDIIIEATSPTITITMRACKVVTLKSVFTQNTTNGTITLSVSVGDSSIEVIKGQGDKSNLVFSQNISSISEVRENESGSELPNSRFKAWLATTLIKAAS